MEKVDTFPEKSTAHLTALSFRRKSYLARVISAVDGFEVWKSVETVREGGRVA
jgi:Ser/Thr protein kinase RdoA (MazF antagonist)